MAKYEPVHSLHVPRFVGIVTFMRLPHVQTTQDVDFVVVGAPFDTGASFRVGQRFAPSAIRQMSLLLRPYNYAQGINVFDYLSGVDYGDAPVVPGYTHESYKAIEDTLFPLFAAGVVPITLGGDHSISLPELRSAAKAYGRVGMVHFDSHSDTWNETLGQRYMHGTPFRRALEEGLLDGDRCVQVGIRGPEYEASDVEGPREFGFDVYTIDDVKKLPAAELGRRICAKVGDGPALLTFDIDVLDPAYAPGTGTPEVGGLTSWEVLQIVRELKGPRFVGFDLVEVLPAYDTADITSIMASNLVFEFLTLIALAKRAASRPGVTPSASTGQ
jgi:agmatinase